MKFYVFKKESLVLFIIICMVVITASIWFFAHSDSVPASGADVGSKAREIHLITSEFKTKMDDGSEMEVYRWDPGTIFVEKGEKVNLKIFGVNGREHPFIIEGTNIKGTVKKGKETVVPLQFQDEGVYRLICHTHSQSMKGHMIGYIIVD
ncbi:hypothetical protein CVD25_08045 [Bacillus canaveralius]|uniref:EfeO-type cupredoxin-like domain-containing protein n=1 Tax=Bacillus canaveralius TaxID=1403243 RepID=A0A2N5GIQ7_9BACI|nr:cupredoxin domain-containing protein [Bacillus canaveralius]PLR80810.1 hypothetical protein CU635_17330 [Bacillus canaveralius]PLR98313.1 hypothetical protein CVD25_08045 [Bacillus canaveralius]